MEHKLEAPPRIHIFVGKTRVEFDTNMVTGLDIKVAAGVPPENDLARRVHGELVLVTNEETIEIKNGDHFENLPPGTIS